MSYQRETRKVVVEVAPFFLQEGSQPEDDVFLWAYHVSITNQRNHPIHLHHRHWYITDASGEIQEVQGKGVVGEQPVILPDRTYEYASGVALKTPSGMMYGTYLMKSPETGEELVVDIPAFSLDSPFEQGVVH